MLQIWICISHQMKSVAEFNHVNNILGTSEINLLCYNLIWKNSLYRYISGFCAQVLYNLKNHKVASSIDCHFEPHAVSNSVGIDCYLSETVSEIFSYFHIYLLSVVGAVPSRSHLVHQRTLWPKPSNFDEESRRKKNRERETLN